ncbi:MAG TPA: GNAT family N-acetyltransferase [Chitinophagaceae bacterium]|nr:GNAT family N-acetyltransferase [Chitinophagaceae bacterium]
MKDYHIRQATIADLPVLLTFEQALIEAERPFDPTLVPEPFHYYNLEELILSPDAEVLVAEADDQPVASGHCRIYEAKHQYQFERYAFLGFMYTVPAYRGQGITQDIMQRLIAWAGANGLKEVRLQVYDENIAAVKAYEKAGFKKILAEMRLSTNREKE